MTNRNARSPLALTAIAAVLAFAPTPALAQEAAVPDPAPAAAPAPAAPTIVIPAPIVVPEMRSAPVVQAAPEPAAVADPAPVTAPASRAASRPAARPTTSTMTAAPVAAAAAPATMMATPVISTEPVAAAVDVPQVAAVEPGPQPVAPAQNDNAVLGLGLLGLVALGGAGAYGLARRRRRVDGPAIAYRDERLAAPAPTVTVATSAWVPAVEAAVASEPSSFVRNPVGVAIPAGPLPTGPAMASLVERMASAAPDADNPYTSVKRRRQRVRWLLKQHEYRLREAEDRPFDFRTYATAPKTDRALVDA